MHPLPVGQRIPHPIDARQIAARRYLLPAQSSRFDGGRGRVLRQGGSTTRGSYGAHPRSAPDTPRGVNVLLRPHPATVTPWSLVPEGAYAGVNASMTAPDPSSHQVLADSAKGAKTMMALREPRKSQAIDVSTKGPCRHQRNPGLSAPVEGQDDKDALARDRRQVRVTHHLTTRRVELSNGGQDLAGRRRTVNLKNNAERPRHHQLVASFGSAKGRASLRRRWIVAGDPVGETVFLGVEERNGQLQDPRNCSQRTVIR